MFCLHLVPFSHFRRSETGNACHLEECQGLRMLSLHLIEGWAEHPLCQVLACARNRLLCGALDRRLFRLLFL